jgi:predicted O-linked N-acetylglucosamine transferase (SPINDLY family)
VTEATLALWAKVLAAEPMSRLILLAPPGEIRKRVVDQLGADASRVEFVSFQPREKYLQTYHRIDIGLDTLHYNGHTTSLDSFWMGVPVVSLMGQTSVSRAGFSQAKNLGLAERLVGQSENEFLQLAKTLAADLPALGDLRAGLRARMEKSPLMDGKLFARDVEAVYRNLWTTWASTPR